MSNLIAAQQCTMLRDPGKSADTPINWKPSEMGHLNQRQDKLWDNIDIEEITRPSAVHLRSRSSNPDTLGMNNRRRAFGANNICGRLPIPCLSGK